MNGKLLTTIVSFCAGPGLLMLFPALVQAQDYYISTNNTGTITVYSYTGPGGNVIIPDSINGLPVTALGTGVFSGETNVTSVTIPDSVTSIGDTAFYRCMGLTNVTFGNGVTTIGNSAFTACTSLTRLDLGTSVTTIGYSVFIGCNSLTNMSIPDSVASIGDNAFWDCNSLKSVTIGIGVTNIGNQALNLCSNLTSIVVDSANPNFSSADGVLFDKMKTTLIQCPGGKTDDYVIPEGVITIGGHAFYSCAGLTSLTMPANVTTITFGAGSAFGLCSKLTNIAVNAANPNFSSVDGVLFDKTQSTLLLYPASKVGGYTIPNNVTAIADSAFAFGGGLTSVIIPGSVTSIADYAFHVCSGLTNIVVDGANPNYSSADGVLFDKTQSTLIQCPGGKTGDYVIPNNVNTIGSHSFYSCTSLTSLTIPESVTTIKFAENALANCTSLTDITVEATNPNYSSVDGAVFDKTQTTLIQCPGGKFGGYTVPDGVTTIGNSAFAFCGRLTSVTIGDSVNSIESDAFQNCTNLTSVYFRGNAPDPVGSGVFFQSGNAIAYYLPATTGWSAFAIFAGVPTALWLPQMQTADSNFGMNNGAFGFNISWASDQKVIVEAATSLSNPDWTPVSTNTLTGGSSTFSDADFANHSTRFYRLRSP
ncbi:leucine-rich repeat protein [bacterium]|nr:leucine-rich repeat protein [bacterium]